MDMYRWHHPHPVLADALPADSHVPRHKCILVTIMKNEAPYIVEWATYHYALGFREILVFSNHSDDYTDQILDRLDDLGIVRHRPHPINTFASVGQVTISALRFATCFSQYRDSDYMMMMDADEFLEIGTGDHDLDAFFDRCGPFAAASFLMRGMRAKDNTRIEDGNMLDRFRETGWVRPDPDAPPSEVRGSVKTLALSRFPGGFHRNHRPMSKKFSQLGLRWIDGGGNEMPPEFTDQRVSSVKYSDRDQIGIVNHYALRSKESFMVKVDRGASSANDRKVLDDAALQKWTKYWTGRMKAGSTPEHQQFRPPAFDALAEHIRRDSIIAELQEAALATHRAKARAMLDTEGGARIAKAIGLDTAELAG